MGRRKRLKTPPIQLEKKAILTIIGIVLIAFSLLLLLSLFMSTGILLTLKDYFYNLFGIGIIFVPFLIILTTLPLLGFKLKITKINIIAGIIAALLSFLGLIASFSQNMSGILGYSIWSVFEPLVTAIGAFMILFFAFVVSLIIATNTSLDQIVATIISAYKKIVGLIKAIKKILFGDSKPKYIIRAPI